MANSSLALSFISHGTWRSKGILSKKHIDYCINVALPTLESRAICSLVRVPDEYTPVPSITSTSCKKKCTLQLFVERGRLWPISSFKKEYNVLYESQYGFRECRSTDHAILDIVNKIQSYMDKGMFSCGVFIDLQKAFDTVDHAILLQKLFHYGVCGIVNDWFSSYLINRVQTTQIGSHVLYVKNKIPRVVSRKGMYWGLCSFSFMWIIYIKHQTNWNSFYLRMTPTFCVQIEIWDPLKL